MKEAGYPNGFNVDWVTPAPNYYSRRERVVSQLQNIGIRLKLQVMERGVYQKKREGGLKEWPGVNIIFAGARIGASWANWYESNFKCGGYLAADAICVRDLDAKFEQYMASDRPAERKALAEQIQREILDNYYFVPVFRHAFIGAIGPRIAATKWQDVVPDGAHDRLRLSLGRHRAQELTQHLSCFASGGNSGGDDIEGPMVGEISLGAQRSSRFAFKRTVEKPSAGLHE